MKKHIYFREDIQELKELPLIEPHCYYLGELTEHQIECVQDWIDKSAVSFKELEDLIGVLNDPLCDSVFGIKLITLPSRTHDDDLCGKDFGNLTLAKPISFIKLDDKK